MWPASASPSPACSQRPHSPASGPRCARQGWTRRWRSAKSSSAPEGQAAAIFVFFVQDRADSADMLEVTEHGPAEVPSRLLFATALLLALLAAWYLKGA